MVPDRAPHTKPKALNYALQFARGDFVVVYDAEDRPQPDQLRRAWEVFRHAPAELGCLQAQLNIYNPRQSWLTRQFTIEYSALFDAILPALEQLRLPVPLGGTSNHFPRATLIGVGAWDPYNVTEDADLGIRLARQGYPHGRAGFDDVGRGPAGLRHLDQAAHALAQGLDAPCQVSPTSFEFQWVRLLWSLDFLPCRNAVATIRLDPRTRNGSGEQRHLLASRLRGREARLLSLHDFLVALG